MKKIIIPALLFVLFFLGCSNPTSSEDINKVTVSYDSQGGSAVSSLKVEPGKTVETLPVSEKFTYHFDGWYTAVNGGGTKFLADTIVKENMTVYASWTQTAIVSTLAGSGTAGSSDGTGTAASFNQPAGIATDSAGNLYVADRMNHLIRKISPEGIVTTLAGTGAATFNEPLGVAVDKEGTVYVADHNNNLIRKITPAGVVSTLAGSGDEGSYDGTGIEASFNKPWGIAVDSEGTVYVAEYGNNLIRKISPAGVVTTLAGSGDEGSDDGTGANATFKALSGMTVDSAGNLYVVDNANGLIRKITAEGVVTTLAGSGTFGSDDGTGTSASFGIPIGVAVDSAGNVYVADNGNNMIRKITPAGVVTTLAGSRTRGSNDGDGTDATFYSPFGVAVDSQGTLYVADTYNYLIRKITQ